MASVIMATWRRYNPQIHLKIHNDCSTGISETNRYSQEDAMGKQSRSKKAREKREQDRKKRNYRHKIRELVKNANPLCFIDLPTTSSGKIEKRDFEALELSSIISICERLVEKCRMPFDQVNSVELAMMYNDMKLLGMEPGEPDMRRAFEIWSKANFELPEFLAKVKKILASDPDLSERVRKAGNIDPNTLDFSCVM